MGTETGLLSPRLLARRLRRQATLEDMRLVMVAPTEGVVEDREAFDAVVPRTFVAADFIRHFRRLFVQPRPGEPPVLTELRESVIAATQQTLGMMIGVEMALIEGDAPQVPDDAGASMLFTVEREPSPVAATLMSDAATARRLAALLTGRADDQVGPEDGVSALSQVLTVVSGSVQADIGADGRDVTVTVPTPRSSSANPGAPGPTAVLSFASADGTLRLAISLTLAESAADATLAAAS
jgi:hypothetical protein